MSYNKHPWDVILPLLHKLSDMGIKPDLALALQRWLSKAHNHMYTLHMTGLFPEKNKQHTLDVIGKSCSNNGASHGSGKCKQVRLGQIDI